MISVNVSAMEGIEERIREAFRVQPSPLRMDSMPPALSFVGDVRYVDDMRTVPQEARDRPDNRLLEVAGDIRSALVDRGRLRPGDWNGATKLVRPRLSWIRDAATTRYGERDGIPIGSRVQWDALHFVMERSVDDAVAFHVALWDHVYSAGRVPVGIEYARNAPVLVVR